MRRVVELFRRRSRLSVFGSLGASVGVTLAFWLQFRTSSEGRQVNAHQRGQLVRCQSASLPGWPEAVSLLRADCERELPEQTAGAPDQEQSIVLPTAEPDFTPPRLNELVARFSENCACCHGADGSGNFARMLLPVIPDFTNLVWQVSQTDVAIVNQIADGTDALMPSFRHKLSSRQMLELAVYIRSFAIRQTIKPETSAVPAVTPSVTPAEIYQTHCIDCHEGDGRGNNAMRTARPGLPDFTSSRWQKSRSDHNLARSILEGTGTIMLPMRDTLETVDVREMVALVRAFEGGRQTIAVEGPTAPDPQASGGVTGVPEQTDRSRAATASKLAPTADDAARMRVGAGVFRQYCIACHSADGTGRLLRKQMPSIPDFTNSTWQRQHTDPKLIVSIMDGKGTQMPASRGRVTDAQARDLVAYLRSFGPRTLPEKRPGSKSEFEKSFRELEERWNELEKSRQKIELPKQAK